MAMETNSQLRMRILYLEGELEKWKSEYSVWQEYIHELEKKLRLNPWTRDTFASKDPRIVQNGNYVDDH